MSTRIPDLRSLPMCGWRMTWLILASGAITSPLMATNTLVAAERAALTTPKIEGLIAGAWAQDITSPHPVSLNGGMADRISKGANDPLHARCLVLRSGPQALALVTCDSCMLPRNLIDEARTKASVQTSIPASQILISATHAHSCPTVTGVFQSDPDPTYARFLVEQIVTGITRAATQAEPAQLAWLSVVDDTQLFNRRWRLKDGTLYENPFGQKVDRVKMNPGLNNPDVAASMGLTDPQVSVLSVQSRSGRPLALWANYSLHYVGGVPGEIMSADYFGAFAERITRRLGATGQQPPFVAAMTNGTSGDVNNIDFSRATAIPRKPYEQMGLVAESVAERVQKGLLLAVYRSDVSLDSVDTELELGVRKPTADEVAEARQRIADQRPPLQGLPAIYARETILLNDYPATVKVRLQALRIGTAAIVSSPCETFTATGLAIKQQSPFQQTFTIELANGYNGYLPTPEDHALGGYETWRARSSYLAVDAEPIIRQTQLSLLQQLHARQPLKP